MAGTLVAAFGDSSAQVIGGRALMGLAAAFVMPSTLSILTNVFPAHERAKAIGVWAGIAGGGAALGPIASGYLLGHFWWGSRLPRQHPRHRAGAHRRQDPAADLP